MKDKDKRKDNETGSEAQNGSNGLHFHFSTNIAHTNTFNQISSFCQNLDGVYKRFGNIIKLSSRLLLKIQERKQVGNKSKRYLSLYTTEGNKLVFLKYISGLLEVEGKDNTYKFDCLIEGKRIYYLLELTPTTAKITRFLPLYTNRGKK
jgi:hypothetical protein